MCQHKDEHMLILYEFGPRISQQEIALGKIDFVILGRTARLHLLAFLTIGHDSEFMT
jgi:hypothetical protein